MRVREFRFLRREERFIDRAWLDWSRPYEYGYALSILRAMGPVVVHNAACGHATIHRQFAERLNALARSVMHTDNQDRTGIPEFEPFQIYDLREDLPRAFDLVLCISALEELGPHIAALVPVALRNLWAQVAPGGRLVVTCDVPPVLVAVLERFAGRPLGREGDILTVENSIYPRPDWSGLSVVLLDVEKKNEARSPDQANAAVDHG